jgi:glucose/arabinose dehydrogenase
MGKGPALRPRLEEPPLTRRPQHRAALSAAVLTAVVGLLVAACVPAPAPTSTTTTTTGPGGPVTNVAVAQTVPGFASPWEIAFTPDGTPIVTERPGRVTAVVNGARKVVGSIPDVVASGEGGLLGLVVDPGFATNRRIYTCYVSGAGSTAVDERIVRFRVAEDLGSLTEQTPILTGIPKGANGNRHTGCRLAIGPDGMLWAGTGDVVTPTLPQDPTSRAGKVLRMTLDGAPAPGNPGGSWDPYVYTLGHRNVQGLTFRPSDGAAFSVEHGTGCDDEVNRLTPGANFGWNPVGPGGTYDENAPMTSPAVPGAVAAVWSSGCPTIAPSGATFVTGSQWGGWTDQLAVAVLKGSRLMFVRLNGSTLVGTDDRLTDRGRLRTVRNGPDGSLWVAQDANPGSLFRLVPA